MNEHSKDGDQRDETSFEVIRDTAQDLAATAYEMNLPQKTGMSLLVIGLLLVVGALVTGGAGSALQLLFAIVAAIAGGAGIISICIGWLFYR